ncbi:MAG: WecB/TagA/CpsF family glycosyltransferase [Acidimicrobiales bacterium]
MAYPPSVDLFGVRLDNVTEDDVIDRIISSSIRGQGGWVVTPNVDFLRQIVADPVLAELVGGADLAIPDGMPLVWASRLQGTPLGSRVPASQLIYPLCRRAAARGLSIFLLGGEPGAAEAAGAVLTKEAPTLRIVGSYSPPLGFERDPAAIAAIIEQLAERAPEIVFCAFGFPKQERLITAIRGHLPGAWFLGVGGTFTIISGQTPHAPEWMGNAGLEWLHRLRLEPRRLFRRYVIQDAPFTLRLLVVSARRRVAKDRKRTPGNPPGVARLPEGE